MSVNTIDARLLAKMFLGGAINIRDNKEHINELNVFPVPDGDTGTNMTLTIMSAAKEVAQLYSVSDIDMTTLCKAISSGSLRGARGNSGVILSQLFRGFTKIVKEKNEIDTSVIADAFDKAVESAYKAVMKPKEGTILTVAKGMADKARDMSNAGEKDIDSYFQAVLKSGRETLDKTPDMLPVLKQAGVVDSGGEGLMVVLEGAYEVMMGKEVNLDLDESEPEKEEAHEVVCDERNLKYTYAAEFIILLDKPFNIKSEMDFKSYLESIGENISLVSDDGSVKVHIHTNDPGLALQKAMKYGALNDVKIENMRGEHKSSDTNVSSQGAHSQTNDESMQEPVSEHKDVGFIAVSVGDGIKEIFKSLGADYIIEGGQTMNPSTDDMLKAIDKVNADTIFILPNNKNIILAANQAVTLATDKKIIVIPTKTVPQGITALINYVPDVSPDDNAKNMADEISGVHTGQVTYAVRDTVIDDKTIKQGDFMGIGDHGILSVGSDMSEVTFNMIGDMISDDTELISIYYGSDIKSEDADTLKGLVSEKYPKCDVELEFGGQPIYYYIVSAE
ncbi:MAG: DAK2 domain-containing protein [Lachnospiraceae bacterium]|nr:DAK2 domain-containing protein [Lachnospiraceae bacterium]